MLSRNPPDTGYKFEKHLEAVSNTATIQCSAEHFGCKLIGLGVRNDRLFPLTSHGRLNYITNYIFAEGIVDNWEIAWQIAHHSKLGNKFGFYGCAPLLNELFLKGIYAYDGHKWEQIE